MRDLEILLDDAEIKYREQAWRVYPLRADIKIVKDKNKEMSHGAKYWMWATDMKQTYVAITEDKKLQEIFAGKGLQEHWKEDPEKLAINVENYLLWHESYHPFEAPFSQGRPDTDREKIRQAIWRGLKKANPQMKGPMVLSSVAVAENLVEDFILDNRLYLDNKREHHFREDCIPVFDYIELADEKKADTTQYTITRYLYGAMYGPESTHPFFESKMDATGVDSSEEMMSALLKKKVTLPRKADKGKKTHTLEQYANDVRAVFASDDRYEGIVRMMEVLGKFKASNPKKGGFAQLGQGQGGLEGLAQDLMNGMTEEEKAEFLQQLADASQGEKDAAGQLLQGPGLGCGQNLPKQLQQIDLFAIHEQYKQRKPKTEIYGGAKEGVSVSKGQRHAWKLVKSQVVTKDYLKGMNQVGLEKLIAKTGLPWRVRMANGLYRLNTYELVKKNIQDVVYVEESMDVPDHVEFYLDTSGSMATQGKKGMQFTVGDGGRQDMLYHVVYGFIDALDKGGKVMRKNPKFRINNFADRTVTSPVISASEFLRGNTDVLKTLFMADNGGGTQLKIDDKKHFSGKVTYVIATDGDTYGYEEEGKKMLALASRHNTDVIMFEMGGTYSLGRMVSKKGSPVQYFQVHDAKKMMEDGIKVLLSR